MKDIFWIVGAPPAPLAIMLCPHGGAGLEDELRRMRQGGIGTLVSMLEDWEAGALGLANEDQLAERIGLIFITFPICDRQTPPEISAFRSFAAGLAVRLRAGESVGIHCRGSIGRATIAAACALVHLGWTPGAALTAIEEARGCPVPDTEEQRAWILRYKAQP
jgi:protein-tyrosine phosphatase